MAKPAPPIPAGTIFTFQLPNGLYGACQVLAGLNPGWLLVGVLSGTWTEPPTSDQFTDARPLHQVRGKFGGRIEKIQLPAAPPERFKAIGAAPLHAEWTPILATPYTLDHDWEIVCDTVFREWRWEHDRDAYEAEVKARQAAAVEAAKRREAERRAAWAAIPDRELVKQRPFSGWSGMWGADVSRRANAIYKSAAKALFLDRSEPRQVLEELLNAFNDLNEAKSCIETEEREQIWLYGEDLAKRAGVASAWRRIFESRRDW